MDKFKQTEFAQKVAAGSKKAGEAMKEGTKKAGAAIKEGAQKVKDSEFAAKVSEGTKKAGVAMKEGAQKVKEKSAPALEKAKQNMVKLGQDIKASMDSKPEGGNGSSTSFPEEP